jgi:hypothetical protein
MKRRLSLVAVNVLVFLVLAEMAAVVLSYARNGSFFYTADRTIPPAIVETKARYLDAGPIHVDPLINLVDQATLTPERVQALARISRYKQQLNDLGGRMRRSRIATVHFALDRYYVFTMNRYRAEVAAYDALPSNPSASSVLMLTPPMKNRDGEAFQAGGRTWLPRAHEGDRRIHGPGGVHRRHHGIRRRTRRSVRR